MSDILSVKDNVLQFKQGNTVYSYAAGALKSGAADVKPEIAKGILGSILSEVETKADKLAPEVKTFLTDNIKSFETVLTDKAKLTKIGELKGALDFAHTTNGLEGITEANFATIQEGLLKNPLGKKFLNSGTFEKLTDAKFNWPKQIELEAVHNQLQGLFKATKIDKSKVEALLTNHHEHAGMLLKTAGNPEALQAFYQQHNVDLRSFHTTINELITKDIGELSSELSAVKTHATTLGELKKANADAAVIAEAEKTLKDSVAKIKDLTSSDHGHKVVDAVTKDNALKDVLKEAREASSEVAGHLDSASKKVGKVVAEAEKGAKWISGGKWTSFTHTAETVGKDIEKIGKFRWGKLGVGAAAVGAVGAVIYAATGNSGPGEHARAVNDNSREPIAGRA